MQKGTDQNRVEARIRLRAQEEDDAHITLVLQETISRLEASLREKEEEITQLRQRSSGDHMKFKAQVEKNEQMAFDFSERLRGLEYDKKSSVVIIAAKDRIIERCQQDIQAKEEALFTEKRRWEAQLREKKDIEEQLADAREDTEKAKQEIDEMQKLVTELEVKNKLLDENLGKVSAKHQDIQSKYNELWRRLDSGVGPNLSPSNHTQGGSPDAPSMRSALSSDSEEDGEGNDGPVLNAVIKIAAGQSKSRMSPTRRRLRKGKAKSPGTGDTVKPSDLILRHNSVLSEGSDDSEGEDSINLASIGLSKTPVNAGNTNSTNQSHVLSKGKYSKSLVGSRRVNPARDINPVVEAKPVESTGVNFSTPRSKSAIGSFAKQWAHGSSAVKSTDEGTQLRPSTTPNAITGGLGSVDSDLERSEDFSDVSKNSKQQTSSSKRKKSKVRPKSASSPRKASQKCVSSTSATLNIFSQSETEGQSDNEVRRRPSSIVTMPIKPNLTVNTNLNGSHSSNIDSSNVELNRRIQGLQVAVDHHRNQLEEEQKFYTSQIIKLKSTNEVLIKKVASLEELMLRDHKSLSHERDELDRTVKYLKDQLASSNQFQIPQNNVSPIELEKSGAISTIGDNNFSAIVGQDNTNNGQEPVSSRFVGINTSLQQLHCASEKISPAPVSTSVTKPGTEASSSRRKGKVGAGEIFLPSFDDPISLSSAPNDTKNESDLVMRDISTKISAEGSKTWNEYLKNISSDTKDFVSNSQVAVCGDKNMGLKDAATQCECSYATADKAINTYLDRTNADYTFQNPVVNQDAATQCDYLDSLVSPCVNIRNESSNEAEMVEKEVVDSSENYDIELRTRVTSSEEYEQVKDLESSLMHIFRFLISRLKTACTNLSFLRL